MVRVSEKELDAKVWSQLHAQFIGTILKLDQTTRGGNYLEEIFTRSEKIVFAKRLAIIFMLTQDVSHYRISKTLLVSEATVSRIYARMKSGEFNTICASMRRNKMAPKGFLLQLEILLQAGMPPRGKGRWKRFNELTKKQK